MTFVGEGTHAEFEPMLHHLLSAAPNFSEVVLVTQNGEPIGRLARDDANES